ncbi:hypothetical protein ZIOFF_060229 [Zingiber officinale]|uniref:Uncharacterized protein n=1 Tax=Zingiber officinale TaxID=94328 RepID=A0A8J5F8B5_ZINOF|nr:hypothetical protein ZIOFF_060229 [Zingiber officinale]
MKIALGAAKGLTYLHDVANPPVDCDIRAYAASMECQDTQQFSGFLKGPWNKKKQSSLHMMHNKYEQSCRYEGPRTAEALTEFMNTEGGTNVKLATIPSNSIVYLECFISSTTYLDFGEILYDVNLEYGVSGYPTLKFFPKENKAGEDYEAERE